MIHLKIVPAKIVVFIDTFRTRNVSIIDFGQMENGDHNVSFTCYFAPCVGINGKCFIDFLDGRRNITIEADYPADTNATYHYIGTLDASVQLISVHDMLANGTVQEEAAIHTFIPVSFPTSASHVISVGKYCPTSYVIRRDNVSELCKCAKHVQFLKASIT